MHRKKESCYVTMDIVVHARELKKKNRSAVLNFVLSFAFYGYLCWILMFWMILKIVILITNSNIKHILQFLLNRNELLNCSWVCSGVWSYIEKLDCIGNFFLSLEFFFKSIFIYFYMESCNLLFSFVIFYFLK